VLESIKALDFQPNKAAQMLVTQRTSTLGVILYGTSFYGPARMMVGIEQAARAAGYRLLFYNLENASAEETQSLVETLGGHTVDGVVIISPVRSPIYDDLERGLQGTPIVNVGGALGSAQSSVIIDQHMGSRLATKHLLDMGHRQLAEIRGPLEWYDAKARHEGWITELAIHSLMPVAVEIGSWSAESGYHAAQRLIEGGRNFTGLVVANDQMALGAIRALREHHLSIPEDVSVIGFDDTPEAPYYDPPLTTIRQDFPAMGKQSVEYLLQLIRDSETPMHQRVMYPTLVTRASTQPPR
jgi:LacI family transcriptional regulator